MDKNGIRKYFATLLAQDGFFWGIGGNAGDSGRARAAGAAFLLVNHTAALPVDMPASVLGLLPYADANGVVLRQGPGPDAGIPVFAAAFAADQFRTHLTLLRDLGQAGFAALQNFPTSLHADGKYKAFLEDADMGYPREIELIRLSAQEGFFASAMVGTTDQARAMAAAGADMLVFHPGLNADGEHRDWNASSRERFTPLAAAAREINPNIILARSALPRDEWPPRKREEGVGLVYDGNYDEKRGS